MVTRWHKRHLEECQGSRNQKVEELKKKRARRFPPVIPLKPRTNCLWSRNPPGLIVQKLEKLKLKGLTCLTPEVARSHKLQLLTRCCIAVVLSGFAHDTVCASMHAGDQKCNTFAALIIVISHILTK